MYKTFSIQIQYTVIKADRQVENGRPAARFLMIETHYIDNIESQIMTRGSENMLGPFRVARVCGGSSFIDVSNVSETSFANEAVTLMLQHHSSANVLVEYARRRYFEAGFGERVIVVVGR